MQFQELKNIVEALLLASSEPLSLKQLSQILQTDNTAPKRDELLQAIGQLRDEWEIRGAELTEVASGYRLQIKQAYAVWVGRLWEEKAPRYTRALLETLALIAYRQPITRSEIEDIRGVSISSNIIKTLHEREWIQILGHKDTPGKPALFGTTRQFLDYFNLKSLDQLPSLADLKTLTNTHPELALEYADAEAAEPSQLKQDEPAIDTAIGSDAEPELESTETRH